MVRLISHAALLFVLVAPVSAQSDLRVQVLSYQWTTTHQTLHFSWRGRSTTSCSSTGRVQGSISDSGAFSTFGSSNGTCDTTFTPPVTQTIDIAKPVVFILAETESSRMILTCTRNVRWSQCEALSPGVFIARDTNGRFEVASMKKGKTVWTHFDIVQQSAIIRPEQAVAALVESHTEGPPKDVLLVASYRQKCSGGDTQGCINLATMYRMGWGVEKDMSQANSLYKKACDAGIDDACKHFDPAISTPRESKPSPSEVGTEASLTIDSAPSGADITVDGAFMGDTPSTIKIAAGVHQVVVKKDGFGIWSKALTVTGGLIHLDAELKPETSK